MTSLAKTVAQISLELRSMRGIEEIIYTLSDDIHTLKIMHLASNGNGGSIAAGIDTSSAVAHESNLHVNRNNNNERDMINMLQQQRRRSSSEPMLLDQIVANSQRLQMETAASSTQEERKNVERRPVNKIWERMLQKRANSRPSPSSSHGGGELETFRASAYANPRKLKKLTK